MLEKGEWRAHVRRKKQVLGRILNRGRRRRRDCEQEEITENFQGGEVQNGAWKGCWRRKSGGQTGGRNRSWGRDYEQGGGADNGRGVGEGREVGDMHGGTDRWRDCGQGEEEITKGVLEKEEWEACMEGLTSEGGIVSRG